MALKSEYVALRRSPQKALRILDALTFILFEK